MNRLRTGDKIPRQLGRRGRHCLGGAGRGGSAHVGHKVGNGRVGLVADACHHRNGTCGDGARKSLVVERHEVLVRPAATDEQYRLGTRARHAFDAANEILRCASTFDGHSRDENPRQRPATSERSQDIVHCVSTRRGNKAYNLDICRNGTLSRLVGETFHVKLARQVRDLHAQVPLARQAYREHVEVHTALRGIESEPPRQLDKRANVKFDSACPIAVEPHHAGKRCLLVFHREVDGLVARLVRHLGYLADELYGDVLKRSFCKRHSSRDSEGLTLCLGFPVRGFYCIR